jgi:hypothetical protein
VADFSYGGQVRVAPQQRLQPRLVTEEQVMNTGMTLDRELGAFENDTRRIVATHGIECDNK